MSSVRDSDEQGSMTVLPLMKSPGEKGREGASPATPSDRKKTNRRHPSNSPQGNPEAEPLDDRYAAVAKKL